jgi:hypothetical protein
MTFHAKAINPWTWQDQFTFSQAVEVVFSMNGGGTDRHSRADCQTGEYS